MPVGFHVDRNRGGRPSSASWTDQFRWHVAMGLCRAVPGVNGVPGPQGRPVLGLRRSNCGPARHCFVVRTSLVLNREELFQSRHVLLSKLTFECWLSFGPSLLKTWVLDQFQEYMNIREDQIDISVSADGSHAVIRLSSVPLKTSAFDEMQVPSCVCMCVCMFLCVCVSVCFL